MLGNIQMVRTLLIFFIILVLSGCTTIRSTKLFAPTWFGFTAISEGVYVDNKMSTDQRQEFLKTLSLAKERVSAFFGHIKGTPKVFACATEECYVSHGGTTDKGKAYGASMLLLSPRGLNAVIASHELTHIELHSRVGAFRSWRAIPPWFDEGLAVLVSEDPRYTEDAWLKATDNGCNAPNLENIGEMLGKGDWLLSYGTARREVGAWYLHAGRAGLERLIAEVKNGSDFNSAFNSASIESTTNISFKKDTPCRGIVGVKVSSSSRALFRPHGWRAS